MFAWGFDHTIRRSQQRPGPAALHGPLPEAVPGGGVPVHRAPRIELASFAISQTKLCFVVNGEIVRTAEALAAADQMGAHRGP